MTTNNPARPRSSPPRPTAGDDHSVSGRPGLSPPTGTTRHTESKDHHPTNPSSSPKKGTTTTPCGARPNKQRCRLTVVPKQHDDPTLEDHLYILICQTHHRGFITPTTTFWGRGAPTEVRP